MTISVGARDRLLAALRAGRDLWDACDVVKVDPALVRADAELMAEAKVAFETATSRLRSKLTERCLTARIGSGDIGALERLIAERSELQREQFRAEAAGDAAGAGPDLTKLSDFELECYEAALAHDFSQLSRLIAEKSASHVESMRRSLLEEMARHEAAKDQTERLIEILPPERPRSQEPEREPEPGGLDVLDQATPIPRERVPVRAEPELPAPPAQRPRVYRDPSSRGSNSSDYPL